MKLLILYCHHFGYNAAKKSLDNYIIEKKQDNIKESIVAFIQLEEDDEEILKKQETKLVKNLKWAAGKNNTKKIVLHSFAHLSESKANPDITKTFLDNCETRLKSADYEAYQTPYGYFLDLNINAPGHPFARIFKSF
ncbi:MAG: hypothetical protein Kow0068_08490 [Marinilabiliales bacterium]